jgi:hypothetical protein
MVLLKQKVVYFSLLIRNHRVALADFATTARREQLHKKKEVVYGEGSLPSFSVAEVQAVGFIRSQLELVIYEATEKLRLMQNKS